VATNPYGSVSVRLPEVGTVDFSGGEAPIITAEIVMPE